MSSDMQKILEPVNALAKEAEARGGLIAKMADTMQLMAFKLKQAENNIQLLAEAHQYHEKELQAMRKQILSMQCEQRMPVATDDNYHKQFYAGRAEPS